jgi:hypothetical protein
LALVVGGLVKLEAKDSKTDLRHPVPTSTGAQILTQNQLKSISNSIPNTSKL